MLSSPFVSPADRYPYDLIHTCSSDSLKVLKPCYPANTDSYTVLRVDPIRRFSVKEHSEPFHPRSYSPLINKATHSLYSVDLQPIDLQDNCVVTGSGTYGPAQCRGIYSHGLTARYSTSAYSLLTQFRRSVYDKQGDFLSV